MKDFVIIYQNKFTNALAHYVPRIGKSGPPHDPRYYGMIGGYTITFEDRKFKWNDVCTRILDIALIKLNTENNDGVIRLSIHEYVDVCGITRQTAEEQLKKYTPFFEKFIVDEWLCKDYDEEEYEPGDYLCSAEFYESSAHFSFSSAFLETVRDCNEGKGNVMPFPSLLFRINLGRFPNAYAMGRKITEHKFMNVGKKGEDTITIDALIRSCQNKIKRYGADGHFKRDILTPFERDLDSLADIFSWHYIDLSGEETAPPKNYSEYQSSRIKIKWNNYPYELDLIKNRMVKNTAPPKTSKRGKKSTKK